MGARADFFISYAHPDRAWAEWIAWHLEAAGHSTRLQAWDFRPGTNFVIAMQRATEECERTIAVLSPAYRESLFAQPEGAAAFARDPLGERGLLIPVRVREVSVPGMFSQIVYIDLVGRDEEEEARDALLSGIAPGRMTPREAPAFPGAARATARPHSAPARFPGDLPPVWNVPVTSRNFAEREELVAAIADDLAQSEGDRPATVVLHGLGGAGKTQLAARVAWELRSNYDVVWWIRAAERSVALAELLALARPLGLIDPERGEQVEDLARLRDWLARHDRWLLLIDDAGGIEDIEDLVPPGPRGHVLITSRAAGGWRRVGSPYEVAAWDTAAGARFLINRTQRDDIDEARAITDALGGLPLALEQAGAYIDATGIALRAYRERLEGFAPTLFAYGAPPDYGKTVATTWELAFCEVDKIAHARTLLLGCAVLAPEAIPRELLEEIVSEPLERDAALEALLKFSLVSPRGEAIAMHRLVQEVARRRVGEDVSSSAVKGMVGNLVAAFPDSDDPREWPLSLALLPHALTVLGHDGSELVPAGLIARLITKIARFHDARGEYRSALLAEEWSLNMLESTFATDDALVADTLTNIGVLRTHLGDLSGAKDALERAVAVKEKMCGPHDRRVGEALDNLGNVMRRLGDVDGATACQQRALEIIESHYGRIT